MTAFYDDIGRSYSVRRVPDPRIAALLHARLPVQGAVLNIGAGTGNYEPRRQALVALEPSAVMIAQRADDAAPAVQGIAEALPFRDDCFAAAMAVLSLHHWSDWRAGIREALRVARGRLVLLTWTGFSEPFWLLDYFPEIEDLDRPIFPSVDRLAEEMGPLNVDTVVIPHDCSDGFLCAYWRRPRAYLDPLVRAGISSFAKLADIDARLQRLRDDLDSGHWEARHGHLLSRDDMDYGYRVISSTG